MNPESANGRRTAIIIGGSTSGLMTAALLAKQGWDVRVYEHSTVELVGRGAGIVCHDELLEALDESGADTQDIGVDVAERLAFGDNGDIIGRRPFAQTVTSWDRLFQLVEQDQTSVYAHFSNGAIVKGDLLVGADGFRSSVRQQYLSDIQPIYSGYVIYRGLADEAELDPQIARTVFDRFTFHFPKGTEILGYPIAGLNNNLQVGHRRYNWVWYRQTSTERLEEMLTDAKGCYHPISIAPPLIRPEVIQEMRDAAKAIISPPLLHVLDQVKAPFFTPIYDLLSATFAFGRVALVGDAASVARPHVGIGTTKAAGDALALARAIAREPDLPRALEAYGTERQAIAERCFYRGRQLGSWITGDEPRNQQEADELNELHSIQGVLRHVASSEFLLSGGPLGAVC